MKKFFSFFLLLSVLAATLALYAYGFWYKPLSDAAEANENMGYAICCVAIMNVLIIAGVYGISRGVDWAINNLEK
jgi:nitric oxide reductase large subunit